jgi:hypothetical protein
MYINYNLYNKFLRSLHIFDYLEFNLKNTIGEGLKMFWKYQLTVWLSIHNFYLHFTKVTRKCECFGRIVEPCNSQKYEET